MVDFNFFEPYLDPPSKPNYLRFLWVGVFVAVIAIIGYFQLGYFAQKTLITLAIDENQKFTQSQEVIERLDKIQAKEQQYQAISGITTELTLFETILELKGQLYGGLFDTINRQVPQYVYISSLNMNSTQVVISGYSDSYESIAQFQHQLRTVDRFSDVFVPSIVEDQGNYVFTITAAFALGVPSENK